MKQEERTYLCIDLKSFFASVECVERGLDPMTTNLVVADPERSEGTICLAVSPSMKKLGVRNRCRVFEIPKNIKYIMAPPRMQKYIDYAAGIYSIYLRYIAPEDIHVYSIDEAFLDVTHYLSTYRLTPKEMAVMLMGRITEEIGVRAACGIGTNLYLTKIALDITAKHSPDFIGILNEQTYRENLWDYRPLTDFWRIGPGTARRLANHGIFTMRQIAQADEDMLYGIFGIDAELLIDHAWGREPTTIADIKAYRPKVSGLSSGQVLMRDYTFAEARIIVREMADAMCLDMVDKCLLTSSVTLIICYSGRLDSEPSKGTAKLELDTNADSIVIPAVLEVYDSITARNMPIRKIYVNCNNLTEDCGFQQLDLFDAERTEKLERNRRIQQAMLDIKKKHGKNAIIKGTSLDDAATARERNKQIGGHKSGE